MSDMIMPFSLDLDNNVAICMACSNEYSPYACVTIYSIISNSSMKYQYDIVVMNTDISEANKNKILTMIEGRTNISIRFVDVNDFIEGKTFYTWAHFTKFTYFRLLVPDLFSNYKKVIYLDSDIIVNHDIGELYQTDVEGFLFAAALDTHVAGRLLDDACPERTYYIETLGITDATSYYQCGVSIYNIEEFNKSFTPGYLINKASNSTFKWLDQDFMNVEARGRIKRIENRWNVMVFNGSKIDEDNLQGDLHQEYFEARERPYIVHYIGKSFPIFRPAGDFYYLYWKYARGTPYYELMLSMMVQVVTFNMYAKIKKES